MRALGFGVFSPHGDEPEVPKKKRVVHTRVRRNRMVIAMDTSRMRVKGRKRVSGSPAPSSSSVPRAIPAPQEPCHARALGVVIYRLPLDDHRRPISPDLADKESVANVRFSAAVVAKSTTDLASLMPFALIAPESTKNRHQGQLLNTAPSSPAPSSEDEHAPSVDTTASSVPQTPASLSSARNPTFLHGTPEDLKGIFVRKFRWGTIDVLDPSHCDFARTENGRAVYSLECLCFICFCLCDLV